MTQLATAHGAHIVVGFPWLPILVWFIICDRRRRQTRATTPGAARRAVDPRARFVQHAQVVGSAIIVCLSVWLGLGGGYFWPGWVLLGGIVTVALHARYAYGGSFDDEAGSEQVPTLHA